MEEEDQVAPGDWGMDEYEEEEDEEEQPKVVPLKEVNILSTLHPNCNGVDF